MSDTVSSASQTISTQLTDALNQYMCMSYGIKMFCWLLLLCFLLYSISIISRPRKFYKYDDDDYYNDDDIMYRHPMFIENFENETQGIFEPKKSYKFKRIQLTAPSDEFKNPENMYFGQVNVYVIPNESELTYKLQAFVNLSILDGNIYIDDPIEISQKYTLMLANGSESFEFELKKDNDGLYKLNYETNDPKVISKLMNYNIIHVHYYKNNQSKIILMGKI
jgi:hypothetical protein